MGFKEIEAFNLALLGKQLWQIITHKQSLLAWIFKSRYFSKAYPLIFPLRSRFSYAWRSIHATQSLIRQGARVMIGSGVNTNI